MRVGILYINKGKIIPCIDINENQKQFLDKKLSSGFLYEKIKIRKEKNMCSEEEQMIGRIMDTETMGYAYVYPRGNGKIYGCVDSREPS